MIVYRVEHEETGWGPFQSEFYATGVDYDNIHPFMWGRYLPVHDPTHDDHYDYGHLKRKFGCHDRSDIRAIREEEGKRLADEGWVVCVYEVPDCAVFRAESGKQCVFDITVAVRQFTYDLIQFILGNEVDYVTPSLPTE